MQKLAEICIKRPVFASMLILALVVVGAAAYFKLGVDRLPAVDLPTVAIRTSLPGAGPEEVETQVSEIIEEAVNTVEGIEELRSISSSGVSMVLARFSLSRNVDVAAQDVRDRVASIMRQLPDDVEVPIVSKFDSDSEPVLEIAVAADRSLRELTEIAETTVKEQLERSAGVGEVDVVGGRRRTINIWVDAQKLVAYQLPITAVRDAIARQNSDVPGGLVTNSDREITLRTMGRFTDPRQFNDLVIARKDGQPIRVRDIGRAEDGHEEQRSSSRLNGKTTVTLDIRRQSGANTIKVIEGVRAKLEEIRPQLPQDIQLVVVRDQSRYIYNAIHEINLHLVLGSILACLVVLLFMRSWRSMVIAGVAIPTSVVSTFGMMWALDFTLNSVTMLALVLMVGIVIDDAIVVLENIFRFVEEKQMNAFEAARAATAEIGLAVLATTLSLVVIFIPVSFMSSISGRFLMQFGITAAVAVMVSLLVSFTLTPMMSARLLSGEVRRAERRRQAAAAKHRGLSSERAIGDGPHGGGNGHADGGNGRADDGPVAAGASHGKPPDADASGHGHGDGHGDAASRGGFYGVIDRVYTRLLRFSMRHRVAVSVLALIVIGSSIPLYKSVQLEYTPGDVDEGEFAVYVSAPETASFEATDRVMKAVEQDLQQTRGVDTILSTTGGGNTSGVSAGRIHVNMTPHEQRVWSLDRMLKGFLHGDFTGSFHDNFSQRDVMTTIRKRLGRYPNIRCAVRSYPAFNIGGGNYEIDFVIRGPELEKLAEYTEQLRAKCKELGGIPDADTTLKLDSAELRVKIDRERAADLGIYASDIGTALRLMVGGETEVSRFRDPQAGEEYLVQMRLSEKDRNDPDTLDRLYLPRNLDAGSASGGRPGMSGTGASGGGPQAASGGGQVLVAFSSLASLEPTNAAGRIDRLDRQRSANVRASVGPGYALADRLEAMQKAADEMKMPAAYTTMISGRGRELEKTFTEFMIAFLFSIILMYMILASQFESLLHPLTILLSLPLSVPFALFSLWVTGGTLNLFSALGILVLFGVVKKNSILQIDHMNQLRSHGMDRHTAVITANRDRLRPILMTTLALVAGMLPLAVGTGPGAEERRAVAVVVIGGQTLSLLLTLLVTPVAYTLFDDVGQWLRRRRQQRSPEVVNVKAAKPAAS